MEDRLDILIAIVLGLALVAALAGGRLLADIGYIVESLRDIRHRQDK